MAMWRNQSLLIVPSCSIKYTVPHRSIFKIIKRKDAEEPVPVSEGELQEGPFSNSLNKNWAHLSEEQIAKIQDKSRLPHDVKCEIEGIPEHGDQLRYLQLYKRDYVRSYWAKYGEASGLKPGVCWPSIDELKFKMEYEKTFIPDFKESLEAKRKARQEEADKLAKYRADILKKLKDLPKAMEGFYERYNEVERQKQEAIDKRERLIQDVREFLGYDILPSDERFSQAVAKMEEQVKAESKVSKKESAKNKMLATLAAMAEEQMQLAQNNAKKASESASPSNEKDDKSKADPATSEDAKSKENPSK